MVRGLQPFPAVCWGVYAHAEAASRLARKIAPIGFLARELLDEIPRVIADIQAGNGEADGKTRSFQAKDFK